MLVANERVAVPDPFPLDGVLVRVPRGSRSHVEVPDPLEGGKSEPPTAGTELPSLGGMRRHRTPFHMGDGSEAGDPTGWSSASGSWQDSSGSYAKHGSYHVAGSHSVATASGMVEQ